MRCGLVGIAVRHGRSACSRTAWPST
jgi:hypothetical protein